MEEEDKINNKYEQKKSRDNYKSSEGIPNFEVLVHLVFASGIDHTKIIKVN